MTQRLQTRRATPRWAAVLFSAMCGALVALASLPARATEPGEGPRVSEERTGALSTREGLRLRLVTELGNVRVLTQPSGKDAQVSYRVRVEADAREPNAQNLLKQFALAARSTPAGVQLIGEVPGSGEAHGKRRARLWVQFEVSVPRHYNLDVDTQGGNIEAQDLEGYARLVTAGGNITAGRVGGPEAAGARLETAGGHITVQEVNGELRASTGGGHVNTADVRGNAILETGGGHIRAGAIHGTARMETGGGSISIPSAGGSVNASTGGGQIDLGEAQGSIRASTGGGGIRVLRVIGPAHLETGAGSILLTRVQSAVRASTGAGSITAWFTSDGKLSGMSLLESGSGDIVVYLPRELQLTIQATIEAGPSFRIETDPSLALKVNYVTSQDGLRGEYALNGGGELLRLKTAAGNIRLKLSDTNQQKGLNQQQMEELKRRLELQPQRLREQMQRHEHHIHFEVERELERAAKEVQRVSERHAREAGRFGELARALERAWWGGVRVDAETQQKKLAHSVRPVYPDVAKQAGIEGAVRLKAVIGKDGSVQSLKLLSGEAVLADAAIGAVRQWRYQPTHVEGRPVNVVTTITVDFRLK